MRALNEHGLPVVIEGEGLLARCLQHEIDHLNGKVYMDRLPLVSRLRIKRDIARRRKQGLFLGYNSRRMVTTIFLGTPALAVPFRPGGFIRKQKWRGLSPRPTGRRGGVT